MKNLSVFFIVSLSFFFTFIDAVDQTIRGDELKIKNDQNFSQSKMVSDDSKNINSIIKNDRQIGISEQIDNSLLKKASLFPVDRLVVIIDGPQRRHIICQSELERMGIDGRKPTIQELITEELIYQDAVKHKIPIDDYADRYIRSIKKHHNIGDKEVDHIFEGAGLNPEEGRQKLQKMGANTTMIDLKVKARIFIPQQEVEEYFNQNPLYKEARYQLEIAFIPFFSQDVKKQQEQVAYLIDQAEHGELDVMWGTPIWIKHDDIAEDKSFITSMKCGEVSKPQRVEGGFEMYRLKAKKERKLIPLQKRFRDIVDTLREPKFHAMFDAYVNELFSTASIIYIDDLDQKST